MRISTEAFREVERAFEEYKRVLMDARDNDTVSNATFRFYTEDVERFLRWLRYDYEPGLRDRP